MTEGKVYKVKISGKLVEVTQEVYLTYYRMDRHARFQQEKDKRNGTVSYHALDTVDMLGEEMIPDSTEMSVEDTVIKNMMCEKLKLCLAMISDSERNLIYSLYYDQLSERDLSKITGVPHTTIHDKKVRALKKLKRLMDA